MKEKPNGKYGDNIMKLCLGTVQFGMDYGILGQKQPPLEQSLQIIEYATKNNIKTIDTANAYGTAENIIGEFVKRKITARRDLEIISKLKPNILDDVIAENYYSVIKENLIDSLNKLNTDYLDGYLLHSSRYVYNDEILYVLSRIKKEGYVKNIGVSVYYPDEAKKGLSSNIIDIIQMPYSIFDQRMKDEGIFLSLDEKAVKLHIRSMFLKGLILTDEAQVPDYLLDAKPVLKKLDSICKKNNISKISLAMAFVKLQQNIDRLVFGVDNLGQLKENISLFENPIDSSVVLDIAKEFDNLNTTIIIPSLWSKK